MQVARATISTGAQHRKQFINGANTRSSRGRLHGHGSQLIDQRHRTRRGVVCSRRSEDSYSAYTVDDLHGKAGQKAKLLNERDVRRRLLRFMREKGSLQSFPTVEQLEAAGERDLAEAVKSYGGWLPVSLKSNMHVDDYSHPASPPSVERFEAGPVSSREPEMEELWKALSEFSRQYETTGKMPTARQLRDAGRQDLVDAIKAKGGFFFVGSIMAAKRRRIQKRGGDSGQVIYSGMPKNETGAPNLAPTSPPPGYPSTFRGNERPPSPPYGSSNGNNGSGGGGLAGGLGGGVGSGRRDMRMEPSLENKSRMKSYIEDDVAPIQERLKTMKGRLQNATERLRQASNEFLGDREEGGKHLPLPRLAERAAHGMAAAEAAAQQSDVEKGRMIDAAMKGSITERGASTVAKAAVTAATEIAEQQEQKLRTAIERELATAADSLERVESGVMRASRSLREIDAAITSAQTKVLMERRDLEDRAKKIDHELDRSWQDLGGKKPRVVPVWIDWPYPGATSVSLVGSYNGWGEPTPLERLQGGSFGSELLMYPGRYEVKFIVDGNWWVDLGRPLVRPGSWDNNNELVVPVMDSEGFWI